jgi:hypothetical protein
MYYNHLSIALLIVPLIVSHFDLNYGYHPNANSVLWAMKYPIRHI